MSEKNAVAWKQNLASLFLSLALCFGIFISAEIYCAFTDHEMPPDKMYMTNPTYIDRYGISRAHPSETYHVTEHSRKTRRLIYDVTYSVDAYSRRNTPVLNLESREKHLLFFGCSYTYGEGLQEKETLPFQTGEKASFFMPYNYAYHGHSPSQMYTKLKSVSLSGEVLQKDGLLIYLFMDEHVNRAVGSMFSVSWAGNYPYYQLNSKEEIVYKGTFTTGRPLLEKTYKLLNKSYFLKRLKVGFPLRMTRKHFLLTARLIEESSKLYHQQFSSGQFYMIIYPGSRYGEKIKNELKEKNVNIIDYSKLFSSNDPRYYLDTEDRHPNAFAIRTLADQLVQDLKLQR